MVPLGNVLTVIGCLGALVMVPHFVMPKKMVQLFIEKFPIDKEGTAAKQLEISCWSERLRGLGRALSGKQTRSMRKP